MPPFLPHLLPLLPLLALLPLLPSTLVATAASNVPPRCLGPILEQAPPEEGPPLLVRDSCGPGKWLVINRGTGDTDCVPHCAEGEALLKGRCRSTAEIEDRACPEPMSHVVNYHGEVECQCYDYLVFHESSGKCDAPYTEGLCSDGQSLQMVTPPEKGGHFDCSENFCEDGGIPMTSSCEQVHAWSRHLHTSYTCSNRTVNPCAGGSHPILNYEIIQYHCGFLTFPYAHFSPQLRSALCPPGQLWAHGECQVIVRNLPTQPRRNRPGGRRRKGFLPTRTRRNKPGGRRKTGFLFSG